MATLKENSRQRELKNRIRISTSIDLELNAKLEEISKKSMIPKSKLIDKALQLLCEEYEQFL